MKKNNWFVPTLILVGIALIVISVWSPQNVFTLNTNKKKLAQVSERIGQVKLFNSQMPAEINVKAEQKLDALDSLRTSENSEAVIEFNNGGQFRLAEKSEALIDRMENGHPVVIVKSGEVFVEKFGESPGYWIRFEGQLYSAADFVLLDKKNAKKLLEEPPSQSNIEQISQVEIESVLNTKKTDFFKCYGQLIQRDPQASGQVLVAFTIERQGATSKVEISKSDIADQNFKTCLKEVVARTKFRAFSGTPVATVFPLKFE